MQQIEKSCSKLIAKIEECDIITKQAKAEKQRLRTKRGDMAQLVERRVRNAKARGSNPLISTKISQSYAMGWRDFFYKGIQRNYSNCAHGVCRANPCGLTLALLRKRPGPLSTNPLISTIRK